jgi:hypothetical protein
MFLPLHDVRALDDPKDGNFISLGRPIHPPILRQEEYVRACHATSLALPLRRRVCALLFDVLLDRNLQVLICRW